MKTDSTLTDQIYAAKQNSLAANALVDQYLPFIRSTVIMFSKAEDAATREDELSIAMFAFHEAVMAYSKEKGAFLGFAKITIRNALIDFHRKERRYKNNISFDDEQKNNTDIAENDIEATTIRLSAKKEITEFAALLSEYKLNLSDIAQNCPKQSRTFRACYTVLQYARENPSVFQQLTASKKLPVKELSKGTGIERKVLERHRKYIVAIMLAYTNDFEIIRQHIKQVAPNRKEDHK